VRAWSKKIGEKSSELKTKIEIWITPDQAQPLPKGDMGVATVRAMAQSTLVLRLKSFAYITGNLKSSNTAS
jgi:hypothetical protein